MTGHGPANCETVSPIGGRRVGGRGAEPPVGHKEWPTESGDRPTGSHLPPTSGGRCRRQRGAATDRRSPLPNRPIQMLPPRGSCRAATEGEAPNRANLARRTADRPPHPHTPMLLSP